MQEYHDCKVFKDITILRMDRHTNRGGLPYESDGDARQKVWIKPLKETNLGVAQAFFDP